MNSKMLANDVKLGIKNVESDLKVFKDKDDMEQFHKLTHLVSGIVFYTNLIGRDAANIDWAQSNREAMVPTFKGLAEALIKLMKVYMTNMVPYDTEHFLKQPDAQEQGQVEVLDKPPKRTMYA
jgi:hypothetical protein